MKHFANSKFRLITVLCFVLSIVSCKKNSSGGPEVGEPVKSGKGEPIGTAVRKEIGAGGGSITSADGTLTITVPPGAVTTNTQFGIQPITNTLYNDESKIAFRLTPEGTTFSKPVEVTRQFSAEQMKGTLPEMITAAYQTAEGKWKAVPGRINKTTRTCSFKTTHFSDWTVEGSIWLYVHNQSKVSFGDTIQIGVVGLRPVYGDELAPLIGVKDIKFTLLQPTKGKLIAHKEYKTIAYFTPMSRPQPNTSNIAEVAVKLSGTQITILDEELPEGYRKFDELTLIAAIEILNDTYMKGTFMGAPIEITNVVATANEMGMAVTGVMNGITIGFTTTGQSPSRYPCGEFFEFGKSNITVTSASGPIPKSYSSTYSECNANNEVVLKYSKGYVNITKWGKVGEFVQGYIVGPVYIQESTPGNCPTYKSHQIEIDFRTVRSL